MSGKYICQSCLRAARQSHPHSLQRIQARHLSASYSRRATPSPDKPSKQEPTQQSYIKQTLQGLTEDLQKQQYLANESLNPPRTSAPSSSSDTQQQQQPLNVRLAQQLRSNFASATETYIAYGATESLFATCASRADYTVPQASDPTLDIPKTAHGEDIGVAGASSAWWYTEAGLNLTPTFNTWAQITFLHMYLLQARMRAFPREHVGTWNQHLTDHFFYEAERRMDELHRVSARQIRTAYLKDLFVQYRGVTASYDEGLVRGDAVLAGAVWRNLYKAAGIEVNTKKGEMSRDVGEVRWVGVAQVVSYIRREVARLDGLSDAEVTSAEFRFGSPEEDKDAVLVEHAGMKEPFVEA